MPQVLRAAVATVLLAAALVTAATAAQVSGLAAVHHDGQTFLSWSAPWGTGWTYRIYASSSAIRDSLDLRGATLLGSAGDSSACDRRLSAASGVTVGFVTGPGGAPHSPAQGLFVATAEAAGPRWYAVTAQAGAGAEDRAVAPGGGALAAPVAETPAVPAPVYQRTLTVTGSAVEVYTLWAGNRDLPGFPAMANRASVPFDCGLVRGGAAPASPLMVRLHPRGAHFLLVTGSSGEPGEWRLALDDPLRSPERNTWWYGYHEDYDIEGANAVPLSGGTRDYTMRRVVFTLEWALRAFPVDRARVYAWGHSMGGTGAVFLAMLRPDLVAAALATVPKLDFSFLDDPDPANLWNTDGPERRMGDRLWGPVSVGLPDPEGLPVYERLDAGRLAVRLEARGMPPVIAFSGRYDTVVGWAEKIPFYAAMRDHRQGGAFFFDGRSHNLTVAAWTPQQSPRRLYRWRLDRSFPALGWCSADHDPGDGQAASGDSVGTLNGFVEWDTAIVDLPARWEVSLSLRDLALAWGTTLRAPDSCTVDVTPRRLQRFAVSPGRAFAWTVVRESDGALLGRGVAEGDSLGLVTVARVPVFRAGSRLALVPLGSPGDGRAAEPWIALAPNPLCGPGSALVSWPGSGPAEVLLLDVSGRAVRRLFAGPVERGTLAVPLDARGLPAGIYFLAARQDGRTAARRLAIVP